MPRAAAAAAAVLFAANRSALATRHGITHGAASICCPLTYLRTSANMGCVMSTAIAFLLCNHRCSVERLTATMAFFPPSPPSYAIETDADGTASIHFAHPEMEAAARHLHTTITPTVRLLETARRQQIVLLHFACPGARTTLLWSHGNAMDVGEMYFFFVQLAERLRVNIAAYDYSGYGGSTGEPNESNTYADIDAVYEHLTASLAVDAESDLVLYGQSVGSGPSLWLASRRRVSALVLHTPLLSGLRVLIPPSQGFCSVGGCCSPVCMYALCDPYPNFRRIKKATCPVLLIHGTHDQTISCSHSFQLLARVPERYKREPFIIDGAGHDNIVEYDPEEYFAAVGAFLASVHEEPAPSSALPGGATPSGDTPILPVLTDGGQACRSSGH